MALDIDYGTMEQYAADIESWGNHFAGLVALGVADEPIDDQIAILNRVVYELEGFLRGLNDEAAYGGIVPASD